KEPIVTVDPDTVYKPGDVLWGTGFGSADPNSYQRVVDVAYDATDNQLVLSMVFDNQLLIPGLNSDTPYLGLGNRDIFILKYSKTGSSAAWGRQIGDAYEQYRSAVALDKAGNVIVVGGFEGNLDFT